MKKYIVAFIVMISSFSSIAQVDTDRVMIIGKNALYFEDYVLAIQYFNQIITAKPYLAEPYYFRAVSKFMLDDFKGAEEDASACLQRNPYYTAAYQLRGAARQNQEKYEDSAADYQRSLEFYPEDKITLVNMGIVNIEMEQYDIADKFFDVLIRRFPDYTPGYLARSHMYLQMKDTTSALADLNKAIEIDPYTSQSFSTRGILYFQQSEYNMALADLDEAIRLDPYFEGNYINRGLVKYYLNDLRGAMADYDRVIEMDEDNLIARFNRGLLRAQVADNNRAIRDFDKVIELQPDNTIAYLNRSILNNEIGNLEGSLSDLNIVLETHPDFFTGYYMRSQLKRELNDLRGAERDYNLARNLEANAHTSSLSNTELADASGTTEKKETRDQTDLDIEKFNLLVTAGEEDSETTKYQRQSRGRVQNMNVPVELEPKFVPTYYESSFDVRRPVYYSETMERANNRLSLDWILKVTNNEAPLNEVQIQTHFRSIQDYSGRIESEPHNAYLYFGRGMDFMQIQDYENAIKDMDKAVELSPDLLVGYFARAILRTAQLEYDYKLSGESAFSDIGKNNVITGLNDITGKLKLPEISIKSVQYDEILKEYEEIIRIDPDFIYAYYNRAEIFTIEKDYRAAITDYTKAIEIEPQFAEAYFNRGISKLAIGETSEGLDDLRKAGELGIVQSYSIIKRMQ
ncbi:MAG: tetratricopeptide repeat protein [Fermentimonas sp.]|nr:tetratricopeptide repeat protein [Fermentimonas sp.]MDD2930412.1 tetratricopeptide repeat protein [Fermentimonas sp.]MDD3188608.1 tetratricopeptide repeat protein [Fermentimonas sp.]MDD3510574.1 tetratricopeptide repeat protein [Fermentimonas sp.]MDD4284244.1 tetratricopeptide repeat protein [Fermentimonas sp.]